MKTTKKIEIQLNRTDAFTAGGKLKNLPGIEDVSIVTVKQIRVKYKFKMITAAEIINTVDGQLITN